MHNGRPGGTRSLLPGAVSSVPSRTVWSMETRVALLELKEAVRPRGDLPRVDTVAPGPLQAPATLISSVGSVAQLAEQWTLNP